MPDPSPAAHPAGPSGDLPRPLLALLAITAGATVANLYYSQPLLGAMAAAFHVRPGGVTAVAAATQLGTAAGFILIIPLGDSRERKSLILATIGLAALMLAAMAFCPSVGWLTAAGFVLGVFCITPHLAVAYAAGLAAPERRGRTVGLVMSGLLVGILLSRTFSGFVGARAGWRAVYALAAGLMALLGTALAIWLPVQRPSRRVPYAQLLGSLWPLWRDEPVLRRHSLLGALGFGAFSVFWTTLAFHLARLPGRYGSETAGLFGLVGAAGALTAAVAGRLAERMGPRPLNGAALALVVGSFALMAAAPQSLFLLAVGVVGMDAGVQANQVSNQTRIYALSAEQRNRLNSVYMVTYFLGGACGSAIGSAAWAAFGWTGVCAAGAAFAATAIVVLFAMG